MKRKFSPRHITNKIVSLISPPKGVDMHKLYPIKYRKRYWFTEKDSNGIDSVVKVEGISKKATSHLLFEAVFKFIWAPSTRNIENTN
jgi:hypothetical protein